MMKSRQMLREKHFGVSAGEERAEGSTPVLGVQWQNFRSFLIKLLNSLVILFVFACSYCILSILLVFVSGYWILKPLNGLLHILPAVSCVH
jgi:hypothetical protein